MASAYQGWRIFVVQDEPLVTFLLEDVLMIAGAQAVVQAARVAEALSAITTAMSEGGIDAAVIDYTLADGKSALPVAVSPCQGLYLPRKAPQARNGTFDSVEQLRQALLEFRQTYNSTWLIARHGFRTPDALRQDQLSPAALAA
jgi:DNA-binding NarL/FixJ family response regulator